jgi:hypothetical protein
MKDRIIKSLPYLAVAAIVLYLAVKYDAVNKGQVEVEEDANAAPKEEILLSLKANFEDEKIGFVPSDSVKFEGNKAALIAKDNLYGPTFESDSLPLFKKTKSVEVSFMLRSSLIIKDALVVVSFENAKGNIIYESAGMTDGFKINEWVHIKNKFEIKSELLAKEEKVKFKAYILNSKGEQLCIDNYEVNLFGFK